MGLFLGTTFHPEALACSDRNYVEILLVSVTICMCIAMCSNEMSLKTPGADCFLGGQFVSGLLHLLNEWQKVDACKPRCL